MSWSGLAMSASSIRFKYSKCLASSGFTKCSVECFTVLYASQDSDITVCNERIPLVPLRYPARYTHGLSFLQFVSSDLVNNLDPHSVTSQIKEGHIFKVPDGPNLTNQSHPQICQASPVLPLEHLPDVLDTGLRFEGQVGVFKSLHRADGSFPLLPLAEVESESGTRVLYRAVFSSLYCQAQLGLGKILQAGSSPLVVVMKVHGCVADVCLWRIVIQSREIEAQFMPDDYLQEGFNLKQT